MSKRNNNFRYQVSSDSLKINKSLPIECKLESIINGLSEFYHKKLNLVGIGFRSWCYFDKVKKCQILCIKVGFSKDILISIPSDVLVVCLKPTLILVKGVDKESVSLLACKIKSIKKPDAYKGKVLDTRMRLFISNLVNKNNNNNKSLWYRFLVN